MKEALKCYDEGIIQDFQDDELRAKLHSNRALVHTKYSLYCIIMLLTYVD